jgi:hypothetical protein
LLNARQERLCQLSKLTGTSICKLHKQYESFTADQLDTVIETVRGVYRAAIIDLIDRVGVATSDYYLSGMSLHDLNALGNEIDLASLNAAVVAEAERTLQESNGVSGKVIA